MWTLSTLVTRKHFFAYQPFHKKWYFINSWHFTLVVLFPYFYCNHTHLLLPTPLPTYTNTYFHEKRWFHCVCPSTGHPPVLPTDSLTLELLPFEQIPWALPECNRSAYAHTYIYIYGPGNIRITFLLLKLKPHKTIIKAIFYIPLITSLDSTSELHQ